MSEYIVNVPDEEAEYFIERFGFENVKLTGYSLTGEIVRCRDCKHKCAYYSCLVWGVCIGNLDGFCWRGERKEGGDD